MPIVLNGTTGITTPTIAATSASTFTGALALPAGGLNVGSGQLAVDASGRVTMASQPAFSAMAADANNISGNAVIAYTGVLFNRGGHYNSSTSRFTAPVAGAYQFHASCYTQSGGGFAASAAIFLNGVMRQVGEVAEVGGNYQFDGINMSVILFLNAGDFVDIRHRSAGPLHTNSTNNNFSGALIG